MQKVKFYLIPVQSSESISTEAMKTLKEVILQIKENADEFTILNNFYLISDIFNKGKLDSDTKFLLQLSKGDQYNDVDDIDLSDYHNQLVSMEKDNDLNVNDKRLIFDKESLIHNYQDIALNLLNFSELFDWKKKCFPRLLFTEDSFGINKNPFNSSILRFNELFNKTVQCLTELNNKIDELITKDISERIVILQASLNNISCSGKGNNETQMFEKKVYVIFQNSRSDYTISCTPHFKLIRNDSNYRIYFSWGNNNIREKSFIITKIGGHWNDSVDSVESEIKIV